MENKRVLGMQILQGKKRTHTVQLDFTHINPEYVGTFKFHHPTLMERMQIGVLKSQLLNGLEGKVDILTDNIAHMAATLEYVLDEKPEWFNADTLYDYEILETVYDEYIKWINTFRKKSGGDNNEGDSATS